MRILLSAYACEPGKGSEPGVGWNWALALCRQGHQVHVITRCNNGPAIERAMQGESLPIRFAYYDLGRFARVWKHWPGGIYLYYLLWQIGAYRLARKLHQFKPFDCVHHITFVAYRQPSFMGRLGIPFLFGPVGGGEAMPPPFRNGIPLHGRVAEFVRDLGSALVGFDPLMAMTFSRATRIACTSRETLSRIPRRFHRKCVVQLAIGIDEREIRSAGQAAPHPPQFLFVGRLLYWKGVHLAIRAFAQVRRAAPDARLKIVGSGPDRRWLESVAERAGIAAAIEWIAAKPHSEISQELAASTALIFPSLHDSGGMVVLEALAVGAPVVCLDLGGPGAIVDASCGIAVRADGREAAAVQQLAEAMISLAADPEYRARLAAGAFERARKLTWDRACGALYSLESKPD